MDRPKRDKPKPRQCERLQPNSGNRCASTAGSARMRFCFFHSDEAGDRLAGDWREADEWRTVTLELPVGMFTKPAEQERREWFRAAGVTLLDALATGPSQG